MLYSTEIKRKNKSCLFSYRPGFGRLLFHLLLLLTGHFAVQSFALDFSENQIQQVKTRYGEKVETRLREWQQLIVELRDKPDLEQLQAVNVFLNAASFVEDSVLWDKTDYWATPLEFLILNAGDCEDFSIAKYFTLHTIGMDAEKLRITYVKSKPLNQAHMVLAYYSSPTAEPLILDNLNKELLPASQRTDLIPVYSFNAEVLWLARSRNEQLRAGSPDQLGLWQDLKRRMQYETF